MTVLDDVRLQVAQLRAERDQVIGYLAASAGTVGTAVDAMRAAAAAGDDPTLAAADQAVTAARSGRRVVLDDLSDVDAQLSATVARMLAAGVDPCDAEPDVPLLLLPVRLETRYSADRASLRVRIFPDDVHVDRLDPGLSEVEAAAGRRYWQTLWDGTSTETAAWNQLVRVVHRQRAAYVAAALMPTNLADRPDPAAATPAPVFPVVPGRPLRPPVARALPDRFVVLVIQGADQAMTTGEVVPTEVVVGLSADDDPLSVVSTGSATVGAGMEWMVDFDRATAIGLGVTVVLPQPGEPVDRVFAIGVRSSLDPVAAAEELERLLLAHRFSDGLAVLPQGAPTNNTETDRTSWSSHPDPMQPPTRAVPTVPVGDTALLVRALGAGSDVLTQVTGADLAEQDLSRQLHTGLWSCTWGTFLDRIGTRVPGLFDDSTVEDLRDYFAGWVRGAGPLPAIRVGNQPYGVLPVSDLSSWSGQDVTTLETALIGLLGRIRSMWAAGTAGVPTVTGSGPIDDTLLDILGSAGIQLGMRVRSMVSSSTVSVVPPLLGITDEDSPLQETLDLLLC